MQDRIIPSLSKDSAPRRAVGKRKWLPAAKVAVSIALLAALMRNLDVAGVGAALVKIPASAVAVAVALIAIQACVQGVRWWLVIGVVFGKMPLSRVVQLTFVGLFFNQVLPTSVGGDAVRVWHLHRGGVRLRSAIKSVLLERVWGVLALSFLVAAGLLYLGDRLDNPPLRFGLIATLPLGLLGVAVLISLDLMPPAFRRWRVLAALSRLGGDARQLFLTPALAPPILLLSILGHILSSLVVFALAEGLRLDLSVWDCIAIVPSVLLATLIPISFAGWGLREGAMVVLLGYLGTGADLALAVSLLFGVTIIIAALPGCFFWLRWRDAAAAETPKTADEV